MKKTFLLAGFIAMISIIGIFANPTKASAYGRYGSHRVGGYNSHGLGSHYVGGYQRYPSYSYRSYSYHSRY